MSRYDRQSFLGKHSPETLNSTAVGIVGLGGGGSHLVQQFAHVGIGKFVLADPDTIDDSNTTRLVGGTQQDVKNRAKKTEISARMIRGLMPNAEIDAACGEWPAAAEQLKYCDLIVGAVDSYGVRNELEKFARRYLIPYIDIGMDVHIRKGGGHFVSGQVILSMPGNPCLRCCGLITDEKLKQEANTYGAAGERPQVIWPNGILASTAVWIAIQMLTPWFPVSAGLIYLEYDGNRGTLSTSKKTTFLMSESCRHYPPWQRGDPFFDMRKRLTDSGRDSPHY